MPTFFLLGRTTRCPIHTIHIGRAWGTVEIHAWGCSMLFCTPANNNEPR